MPSYRSFHGLKRSFSLKVLVIYLVLLTIISSLSLYFGAVNISLFDLKHLFFYENLTISRILELRLNGLLQASLVGSILALSGLVLQKLLKNPLADPFILGISAGGTCFASLFILLSTSPFLSLFLKEFYFPGLSFFAFTGCFVAYLLLYLGKKKIRNLGDEYILPVIGIILNSFFASILMMIFTVARPEQLAEIHSWLIGNLQPISFGQLGFLFACTLLPVFFILKSANTLDLMLFGDDFAKSLGANPRHLRNISILMICILISLVVSTAGAIGFVGLIVPHIVKKIHHFQPVFECILCMMLGAIILIVADILSRTLFSPAQLPVGIFTALIGAPSLALILVRKKQW